MDSKYKLMISFGILVFLVLGLYFFTDWYSKITGYLSGEDEKTNLAQCLTENGAEFYTGIYCSQCEKQEKLFGSASKFLNVIECETGSNGSVTDKKCGNLKEIPAWYINKTILYGFKSFDELKNVSGCIEKYNS